MSENLEKIRPALVALEVGESVHRLQSLVPSITVSLRPGLTEKTKPSR